MARGYFNDEFDLPESGFDDADFDGGARVRATPPAPPTPRSFGMGDSSALGLKQQPLMGETPPPAIPQTPPPAIPTTPTQDPFGTTPATPTPPPTSFKGQFTPEDRVTYNTLLNELKGFAEGGIGNFGTTVGGVDIGRLTPEQAYNKLFEILQSPNYWSTPPDTKMRGRVTDWLARLKSSLSGPGSAPGQSEADALRDKHFNIGLERLERIGQYGSRDAEEEMLGSLASRGLLDSGIAARELQRMRSERFQRLADAASQLNAILYSNASEELKQEALMRLAASLQYENESSLARLRAQLQQQMIDRQHSNDFMGFLGNLVGTAAPFFIPGAGPALGLAGAVQRGLSAGRTNYGDQFGVDYESEDPYGFEVSV